uniref:Transmembrane protein 198 n=1 Tax=Globisporangium ultimum (strain ATCC 200006 / CBS 805.95 / DAOM BR144) TaxID=431595 RepID=K3X3G3_GLOUD
MQAKPSKTLLFLICLLVLQLLFMTLGHADDDTQLSSDDIVKSLFDSRDGITAAGCVLAVSAILSGSVMCVAGYKGFPFSRFTVGFVWIGVLAAQIAAYLFKKTALAFTATWITLFLFGSVCGFLAAYYYYTVFDAGFAAGVVLGGWIHTSVGYLLNPINPNIMLIILMFILGVPGGFLAEKHGKPMLVIATSVIGAQFLVWGIGYFAGDYPLANDLKRYASKDEIDRHWEYSIPSAWWAYLAAMIALSVLGVLFQSRLTGRGGNFHLESANDEAEERAIARALATPTLESRSTDFHEIV